MKSRSVIAALIVVAAILLSACTTTTMTPQEVALVQAQLELNTLEISCPAGCSVNYRDPRTQVQMPQHESWAGAFRDVGVALVGQTPVLGMYGLGARALDSLSDLGTAGFVALQGSGAVTNTTTQIDRSTDQSVDYSANRGRIGSADDYTHAPTVVMQPRPVIVEQPAPIMVSAPEPMASGPTPD